MTLRILVLLIGICLTTSGIAQEGFLNKVKEKVKEKVEQKADEKVDEGIDKGLDGVEEGVESGIEVDGEEEADNENQQQKKTDVNTEATTQDDEKTKLQSFSKYDFIPGEKIIFFEDFSSDNIGDFPAIWNTNSSGEVVTFNNFPGKWFKCGSSGVFIPEIKGQFGENFTIEFDLVYAPTIENNFPDASIEIIAQIPGEGIDELVPGNGGCAFKFGYGFTVYNWNDKGYGDISNAIDNSFLTDNIGNKIRVSIAVQKQRVRFWMNEQKLFDLPRLLKSGLVIDRLRFGTNQGDVDDPFLYVSNLRIAVGLPDMRSKLITDGKLVVHGIYFDSGSDKIKPESYGTLKSIAEVLKENSDVKVNIVGHTDSDGADASNLDLSKKRSESVKNALTNDFGIDASRMETDGKGEVEPISDNKTSEGKANNRRVEFIKLSN